MLKVKWTPKRNYCYNFWYGEVAVDWYDKSDWKKKGFYVEIDSREADSDWGGVAGAVCKISAFWPQSPQLVMCASF